MSKVTLLRYVVFLFLFAALVVNYKITKATVERGELTKCLEELPATLITIKPRKITDTDLCVYVYFLMERTVNFPNHFAK